MNERGEYPTDNLKEAYNKYCYWNTKNKHKMEPIPVYRVDSSYRIKYEIHNKCGTENCCRNDPTVDKEVYVTEEDGDVGC